MIEVYFKMPGLPLVLWLWHWSSAACKDSILDLWGSFSSLLCCGRSLHSWEVSELPWRQAWATFTSAWIISESPESSSIVQVSKSGCRAWEFPRRVKNGCHMILICHLVCQERLLLCFSSWIVQKLECNRWNESVNSISELMSLYVPYFRVGLNLCWI